MYILEKTGNGYTNYLISCSYSEVFGNSIISGSPHPEQAKQFRYKKRAEQYAKDNNLKNWKATYLPITEKK